MNANSEWLFVFQDAVHESDPTLAKLKIRAAEAAIFDRIHDYSESRDALEQQALLDALGAIRVLKSIHRFWK